MKTVVVQKKDSYKKTQRRLHQTVKYTAAIVGPLRLPGGAGSLAEFLHCLYIDTFIYL
jgi:hypothetical protein